jgi:hypothetical protein
MTLSKLSGFGFHCLRCVWQGDIRTGQDALAVDSYGAADAIITNPPYIRDLMHRMIAHFSCIAPTWLLLESDWAQTKQAAPFMPACSDIVAIGRVKWIEGSKHTGKDNYARLRFDARHASGPVFHGRDLGHTIPGLRRACGQCGKSLCAAPIQLAVLFGEMQDPRLPSTS